MCDFTDCYCFSTKFIDSNIRHEAVPAPPSACPFTEDQLALFENGLGLLLDSADIPSGYGVTAAELGEGGFEEQEAISIGLSGKTYDIELSQIIWQPRSEIWAKALFAMNTILSV